MPASALGFVLPGLALGSGSIVTRLPRGIIPASGIPLIAQVTVEEDHEDRVEITQHPVEQGSTISDHAYKLPAEVTLHMAWSNSPTLAGNLVSLAVGLAATLFGPIVNTFAAPAAAAQSVLTGNSINQAQAIYDALLALQVSMVPFGIITGKRTYQNMLFASLRVNTTIKSENALVVTAVCHEVIIATTQVVSLQAANQATPSATAPPQAQGTQQPVTAVTATPDNGTLAGALGTLK